MSLLDRWHAPTPLFYKRVIRVSGTLAAGAAALLGADAAGKLLLPNFTYTLLPITILICKNVLVIGIVIAAMSKFAKVTDDENSGKNNQP